MQRKFEKMFLTIQQDERPVAIPGVVSANELH